MLCSSSSIHVVQQQQQCSCTDLQQSTACAAMLPYQHARKVSQHATARCETYLYDDEAALQCTLWTAADLCMDCCSAHMLPSMLA
jgi:hypothetical protein